MLRFEWNKEKAVSNEKKHGVSFEEAATVFGDRLSITVLDTQHSLGEERLVTIGRTSSARIVVVVHLDVDDETIRLVSAPDFRPLREKKSEIAGKKMRKIQM